MKFIRLTFDVAHNPELGKKREIIFISGILLFVVLAYHPVAFLRHTLVWDSRDAYFPWRYFIGSCVGHGIFPLWNPYLFCGYPFFADPQSGAFYPVALLFGWVSGYPVQALNFEFLLTVAIGAMGMYKLARSFSSEPGPAAFGAICFAGCGFFVGNAEHLTFIISLSWLAWLAWSYRMMVERRRFGYAMLSAVFLYLILTGGYPAFLIIGGYILLASFVVVLVRTERKELSRLLLLHFVVAVLFVILSGATVVAFSEASTYINRGSGVSLSKANMGAFTPQAMVSFFLPFITAGDLTLWKTDISLSNAYFGIVAIVLLLTAPPAEKKYRIFWVISILCLMIACGDYLPLRGVLYRFFPLMNLFRFPSIFRAFFLIGIVLLAAAAANGVVSDPGKYRKRLLFVGGFLATGFLLALGFEIARHGLRGGYSIFFTDPSSFLKIATFHERAIMQLSIQLLWLGLLLFAAWYRSARFLTTPFLVVLCAADMLAATQLNMYATVVNDDKLGKIAAGIEKQPHGFPPPELNRAVWHNRDGSQDGLEPLWANLGVFKKKVSPDGYDPFVLKAYDSIESYGSRDYIWGEPVAYLAYDVAKLSKVDTLPGPLFAAVAPATYESLRGKLPSRAAGDTLWFERFEPGNVQVATKTAGAVVVVLQQADYPGWSVWVDGKKQEHFRSGYTNISVVVPGGQHDIVYKFMPRYFRPLAILGYATLMAILLSLLFFRRSLF